MGELEERPTGNGAPEKRFALSKEEFAQKRIAALKGTVGELQTEDPRVLSFTMYGSMARGNPTRESDIDGYLYVEVPPDATPENTDLKQYTEKFTEKLSSKSDMTPEQARQGIKVQAINDQILARDIQSYFDKREAYEQYKKDRDVWADKKVEMEIGMENSGGDLAYAAEYLKQRIEHEKNKPQEPPIPTASSKLYGMFHLDVGGGIGKYREKLIQDLSARGEDGEELWENVIRGTEGMENYLRSTDKHYPRTLAEAREVYMGGEA